MFLNFYSHIFLLFLYLYILYPPYLLFNYIGIIIELTKKPYNSHAVCCEERDNTIIKPSLYWRTV